MHGPSFQEIMAPYHRQASLDAKHERNVENELDNLWIELSQESELDNFIWRNFEDPNGVLAKIMEKIIKAKLDLGALGKEDAVSRSVKLNTYEEIFKIISKELEAIAEHRAEE